MMKRTLILDIVTNMQPIEYGMKSILNLSTGQRKRKFEHICKTVVLTQLFIKQDT